MITLEIYNKLNSDAINVEFVIKHDFCYYSDWTDNGEYSRRFSEMPTKKKLYFESLPKNGIEASNIFQLPIGVAVCSIVSCRFH